MFATTFLLWACIAAGVTCGMGLIFNRKPQITRSVQMFGVFYFISWLFLPSISINMLDTWFMLLVILSIAAVLTICSASKQSLMLLKPPTAGFGVMPLSKGPSLTPLSFPMGFVVIMFVINIMGGVFDAGEKAGVINLEDHDQNDATSKLASEDHAPRVTLNLARRYADTFINSAKQPGLASVATYGDWYDNVTPDGNAVWTAPLEPLHFHRWLWTRSTPGYVIVSQVNHEDDRLVEDQPIFYGTSGFYFGNDLARHLYMNGYDNYHYGGAFFQVDSNGVPYYVVPLERPQVGFWSYYPVKWAVVNATTGEIALAETHDELPLWVSRAYPQSTMESRLAEWARFEGVDLTPGMGVTRDDSGHTLYYTGIQDKDAKDNPKTEDATIGVATINARTGETDFYRHAGITEKAAVDILNDAVLDYAGWHAEDTVLIQVNGMDTYFTLITDGFGDVKVYGMVWQRSGDVPVYGIGKSVEGATRAYLRSYEGNADVDSADFEGLVLTITPVIGGGKTAFYLQIDTVEDIASVVNTENLMEVATTTVGEHVNVTTISAEPGSIKLLVTFSESE